MRNYQTATVSTSSYYHRLKKKKDENTKSPSQNTNPEKHMNKTKKRLSSLPSTSSSSSVSTTASSQTEEEQTVLHLHDETKSEKKSGREPKAERLNTVHMMNTNDKKTHSVEILSDDDGDNSTGDDQHLTSSHERSCRRGRAYGRCTGRYSLGATEKMKEVRREKEDEKKKGEQRSRRSDSRPKHSKNARKSTKPPIISIVSDSEDESENPRKDHAEENESSSPPLGEKEKAHGRNSPSFISSASCSPGMTRSTTAPSDKNRKGDEEVKGRIETDAGLMNEEECRTRKRQRNEEGKTLMSVSKPTYFFKVRIWRPLSSSLSTRRRTDGEGSLSGGGRPRRKKNPKQKVNEEEDDEDERELIREFDLIEVSYEEQAPVIAGAQRRYTSHPYGEDSLKLF